MEGGTILKLGLVAVAGYLVYEWWNGQQTTTTTPAATGSTPPATTPPASNGQLASTYAALTAAATTANTKAVNPTMYDSSGNLLLNGDQWNYYLAQVVPGLTTSPDAVAMFGARPQTPFTAAVYWAQVGPWLITNKGMSGFDAMLWQFGQQMIPTGNDTRRGMWAMNAVRRPA